MEVLTDTDTPVLISNAEVLKLLQKNITKRKEIEAQQELLLEKQQRRRKKKEKDNKKKSKYAHRDWIEEHVHDYLQMTPCVTIKGPAEQEELKSKLVSSKRQQQSSSTSSKNDTATDGQKEAKQQETSTSTPSQSSSGNPRLTGFGLTEAESLQILNFMPTEPVEIHLMVEELHARMTEQRQDQLLELIRSYRNDPTTTTDGSNNDDDDGNNVSDTNQEKFVEDEEMEIVEEGGDEDPTNGIVHPLIKREV